jgi:hypothetical protein
VEQIHIEPEDFAEIISIVEALNDDLKDSLANINELLEFLEGICES